MLSALLALVSLSEVFPRRDALCADCESQEGKAIKLKKKPECCPDCASREVIIRCSEVSVLSALEESRKEALRRKTKSKYGVWNFEDYELPGEEKKRDESKKEWEDAQAVSAREFYDTVIMTETEFSGSFETPIHLDVADSGSFCPRHAEILGFSRILEDEDTRPAVQKLTSYVKNLVWGASPRRKVKKKHMDFRSEIVQSIVPNYESVFVSRTLHCGGAKAGFDRVDGYCLHHAHDEDGEPRYPDVFPIFLANASLGSAKLVGGDEYSCAFEPVVQRPRNVARTSSLPITIRKLLNLRFRGKIPAGLLTALEGISGTDLEYVAEINRYIKNKSGGGTPASSPAPSSSPQPSSGSSVPRIPSAEWDFCVASFGGARSPKAMEKWIWKSVGSKPITKKGRRLDLVKIARSVTNGTTLTVSNLQWEKSE